MVIGFMVLFVVVVAPSVFQSLEPSEAGTLLRRLFPRMFLYGMILTLAAGGIAVASAKFDLAIVSLVSAAGFGINAYVIAPSINRARDKLDNEQNASTREFAWLHTASVSIFAVQFIASVICLTMI
tara:strand:+ start:208 stop:585 length:378 start_codon:yes stop_codon:yes gene_type:complete